MKITRFEDIEAWKHARVLMNRTCEVLRTTKFSSDRDLQRQMRRSAISIMANIAEGFDGGTDAEFRRFLKIAKRSATELQSHLYVALDQKYLDQATFDGLYAGAVEVKKLIGGFVRYLKS